MRFLKKNKFPSGGLKGLLISGVVLTVGFPLFGGVGGSIDVAEVSLEEVIQMALERNYSIRVGELHVKQAEQAVRIGGESLETRLSASAETYRSDGNASFLTGEGKQESISISKRFSTGTEVGVSVDSTSFDDLVENDTRTGTSLSISQNLLKGRGGVANRAPIRIAGKRLGISKEALRQSVIDTVSESHYAYYDALLAEANLRVAQESLELAKQLLKENKKRADLGSIAHSELIQAQAEVAAREERVYHAEGTLVLAKNRLKRIATDEVDQVLNWDFLVVEPDAPIERIIDLKESFRVALEDRPDYRQAIYNLEINEVERLRDSNEALPSIDLYTRMTYFGNSGSFGSSVSRSLEDKRPNYVAGIRVIHSIPNSAASARKSISRIEGNRLQLSLKQLEQAILLDLDSASAQISSNWKRLKSAKLSRELAEKSLRAEQKRYQRGTSSTFILIRLQTDLVNAQIRELVATNDYRKSVIEFDRQTASILYQLNIQLGF